MFLCYTLLLHTISDREKWSRMQQEVHDESHFPTTHATVRKTGGLCVWAGILTLVTSLAEWMTGQQMMDRVGWDATQAINLVANSAPDTCVGECRLPAIRS
jgi:hypothetical protein